MRLYLSNDSYPELRGVPRHWPRSLAWWRAIRRALRTGSFWRFAVAQAAVMAGAIALGAALFADRGHSESSAWAGRLAVLAGGIALAGYLQVSWGGDMMRSHLRAVSDVARHACPRCGQSLYGHLDDRRPNVQCPECGAAVERRVFEPPFPIPPQFRVFPPWRNGGPV